MKLIIAGILFSFASLCAAQNGSIQGYCNKGGTPAITQGLNSTNSLQGIIPGCTVTIYLTGTQTLATIYSSSGGGALSNPFTANLASSSNSGAFVFWASTSAAYDVVGSGGGGNPSCVTVPNCYLSPVVLIQGQFPSTNLTPVAGVTSITDSSTVAGALNFTGNGVSQDGQTFTFTQAFSSLTTTGTSGAATLSDGVLNVPEYQGSISLTTTGTSGAATFSDDILNIPEYGSGGGGLSGVNEQTSSYDAISGDNRKLIAFNSASPVTLTLPSPPSSTWAIDVQDVGTGVLSIALPSGVYLDNLEETSQLKSGMGVWIWTDGTNYFTERGGVLTFANSEPEMAQSVGTSALSCGADSCTISFTENVTPGDALVVEEVHSGAGSPDDAPTDSASNTYTLYNYQLLTGQIDVHQYVACNAAGGSAITVTTPAVFTVVSIYEISNVAASCVDAYSSGQTESETSISTGSITTTEPQDLIFVSGASRSEASYTLTEANSYNEQENSGFIASAINYTSWYGYQPGAGAVSDTVTAAGGSNLGGLYGGIIAFKPSGASTAITEGDLITAQANGGLGPLHPGTAGNVLTSNGPGAMPTYQTGGAIGGSITFAVLPFGVGTNVIGQGLSTPWQGGQDFGNDIDCYGNDGCAVETSNAAGDLSFMAGGQSSFLDEAGDANVTITSTGGAAQVCANTPVTSAYACVDQTGSLTMGGTSSGSAAIGVASAAGSPNGILLPTTTGTSGQVLTTDGGSPQQTSWTTVSGGSGGALVNITGSAQVTASGCTQSASTGGYCAVSGSSTSAITLSVIPGSYNALKIEVYGAATSGNAINIHATFNSDTGTDYALNGSYTIEGNAPAAAGYTSAAYCNLGVLPSSGAGSFVTDLPGYADTSFIKTVIVNWISIFSVSSNTYDQWSGSGCAWNNTDAITSITLTTASEDFSAGTKVLLYGIN